MRYSTNCAKTLTQREPFYIVGTIDADGFFTLKDDPWWQCGMPTTPDSYAYIYIGTVYTESGPYRVAFELDNPIYHFVNGVFREYGIGRLNHKLTIGTYVFDGSADVTIPIYDGTYT